MRKSALKTFAAVGISFLSLGAAIVYAVRNSMVTVAEGGLMLVALFGLYVGVGVLVAVYRLITKLD